MLDTISTDLLEAVTGGSQLPRTRCPSCCSGGQQSDPLADTNGGTGRLPVPNDDLARPDLDLLQ